MKPIFIAKNFKNLSTKEKWKAAGKYFLILCGIGFFMVAAAFLYFLKDLPSPDSVQKRAVVESTKIYDRTGQHLLYDVHGEEKRTIIPFKEIPDTVKFATIALEDQEFYSHHGIKITSIIRSALKDVQKGGAAQGGSTITQQFIKKALLTDEKTITRKGKEIILALELEQRYSKDEILGMYLNQIPYGSSAYGVEAAAQTFFKKPAKELNLSEAALLASLPNAPSYYSPYGSHTDALKARQELALSRMAQQGYITEQQAEDAKQFDILAEIAPRQENISAPHLVMYVKDYLEQKYGEDEVERGGLKVYTTLDWDKQQAAEKAVAEGAEKNKTWNASNAALVAIDTKTGQILSMVGSKNYFDKSIDGQVNVAIRDRQPGSSFKPYVYLASFTKGYTPETLLYDVPTNFSTDDGKEYAPQNYDGSFHGPLQMKESLAMSLNIPAVKTLYLAGVKTSIELAKQLGITTLNQPDRYGLSLVLGGGEVKLLDHVNAYATLATGGIYHEKTAILKVEDNDGKILEEYKSNPGKRVIDEKYVAMLDHIMSTNDYRAPVFGTNNPLKFDNRPVAAKTGTTNEFRDGWTMGYTPSIAVGVWAGNNNNTAMKPGADGINVAAPIWRSFMNQVLGNYAVEQFPKYEKEETGKAVLDGKTDIVDDVKVCKLPGEKDKYCLANDFCPSSLVDKKKFGEIHDILYYVKKDDPRGDYPKNPSDDPQYKNWEKGVQEWMKKEGKKKDKDSEGPMPTDQCTAEDFADSKPSVSLSASANGNVISMKASVESVFDVDKVTFYVDDKEVSATTSQPYETTYTAPADVTGKVSVSVKVMDSAGNTANDDDSVTITVAPPTL